MSDDLADSAASLERLADELDLAARHARAAASHFRDREVPRGCAHVLAAEGHLCVVRTALDGIAVTHARHAVP